MACFAFFCDVGSSEADLPIPHITPPPPRFFIPLAIALDIFSFHHQYQSDVSPQDGCFTPVHIRRAILTQRARTSCFSTGC